MIYLLFFVPIGLTLLGMICAEDLRITRSQQREWEERWAHLTPEQIDEIGRRYWA